MSSLHMNELGISIIIYNKENHIKEATLKANIVEPALAVFMYPDNPNLYLFQEHTQEEMDAWKLVRVSEDFRVIALGLPVPRYQGNPLDPPLRSRFQARDINPLPFKVKSVLLCNNII